MKKTLVVLVLLSSAPAFAKPPLTTRRLAGAAAGAILALAATGSAQAETWIFSDRQVVAGTLPSSAKEAEKALQPLLARGKLAPFAPALTAAGTRAPGHSGFTVVLKTTEANRAVWHVKAFDSVGDKVGMESFTVSQAGPGKLLLTRSGTSGPPSAGPPIQPVHQVDLSAEK